MAAGQSTEDRTAIGSKGVARAVAGKLGEGRTGPDGGKIQGVQRPRGERGSEREGTDGAINGRVAPLMGG